MSYNITLNSKNAISKNTYKYDFLQGAFDVPDGAEMCISSIMMPYSWVNVSSVLGNNVLGYAIPAGSSVQYFSTTLPDGFYDINALNTALQSLFISNGHYWVNTSSGTLNAVYYYPITLSYNETLYTTSITTITIPATASLSTVFGTNVSAGAWSGGGYPTTLLSTYNFASLFIPETVTSPKSLGYMLGFTGASSITSPATSNGTFYPTLGSTSAVSQVSNGNSMTSAPFFNALGTSVNGVVVRCSLVSNPVCANSDIMDAFPITVGYGSNLNYCPQMENWVKMKSGKVSNLVIYFSDDNLNPLGMLDSNVLITLKIKFPNK